jgi:hypothetical protein
LSASFSACNMSISSFSWTFSPPKSVLCKRAIWKGSSATEQRRNAYLLKCLHKQTRALDRTSSFSSSFSSISSLFRSVSEVTCKPVRFMPECPHSRAVNGITFGVRCSLPLHLTTLNSFALPNFAGRPPRASRRCPPWPSGPCASKAGPGSYLLADIGRKL